MNDTYHTPLWHTGVSDVRPQSVQPEAAPVYPSMDAMLPHGSEPFVRCHYCHMPTSLPNARLAKDLYGTWFSQGHWYDKVCARALVTLGRIAIIQ